MKTSNNLKKFALCGACALFAAGSADAKPGKEKGGGKGGPPPHAQNNGNQGNKGNSGNKGKDHNHKSHDDVFDVNKARFMDRDRSSILDVFSGYKDNTYGLPPGLAKNYRQGKPLPPGWQKKVGVGSVLDENIRGFLHPVDRGLFPGLTPIPQTNLYMMGDRLLRVHEPGWTIIDILRIPTVRLN